MLQLENINENIEKLILNDKLTLSCKDLEEKVRLLIFRDLFRLGWSWKTIDDSIICSPPAFYDKAIIKKAMSIKREEILKNNSDWIDRHIHLAKENLADGIDVMRSKIKPVVEECKTQKQHDIFRIFRYYWSSPYSEYVGRRIRLLIRDAGLPNKPVIGIAALGSPIIHIPERDDFVGWDLKTRTENLNYTMDAYVIGALPPYNHLLGGKLISYIIASKEVRKIYEKKYKDKLTLISGRKRNKLVGLFTTSLYGRSAQYNRLKFNDELLYQPIGETRGYGTLHLTKETFSAMQDYLNSKGFNLSNRFGSGPIWTMRVIQKAGALLNFDPDFILKHSFKRGIYFIPYASNAVEFLNGETKRVKYFNYSKKELVDFWKDRWLNMRKENPEIIERVVNFNPNNFEINRLVRP
jgi:uncharacterized protein DUF4338